MHKSIYGICAVLAAVCSLSPVTSHAEESEHRSFYETVGELGLAETVLADGEMFYYVSGTFPLEVGNVTQTVQYEALYIGSGDSFTCHFNVWYRDGSQEWITQSRGAPQIFSGYIAAQTYYYYDSSCTGVVTLTAFYSNDQTAVQNVEINSSDYTNLVTAIYHPAHAGATLGSIATEISGGDQDATEPTGGFQLPEEWIDGGQTLPAATEPTFPSGFDPDSALQQFADITYELDDGVKSGIGFFWAVLTRCIDALGVWTYVFFGMLFVLIIWFIKGQ